MKSILPLQENVYASIFSFAASHPGLISDEGIALLGYFPVFSFLHSIVSMQIA